MKLGSLVATIALLWGMLGQSPAIAASSFDSAYRFESAFVTLRAGETAQLSVFFDNIGTSAWAAGTSAQVNLAACQSDKVTCGTSSDKIAWNPGTWPSSVAYATQAKPVVVPGDFTAFTYSIKAPATIASGTYRFNGDLVLAATGVRLHPEGYYQEATVTGPSAPAPGASAPSDVRAFAGNYDSGSTANDVRILFTAPTGNIIRDYQVQRAPGLCPVPASSAAFSTNTTVTALAGNEAVATENDLRSGSWCYQIRTTDPSTGSFAYSNQSSVTVFGPAAGSAATSTSAVLATSSGTSSTLDAGDVFTITFSQAVLVSSVATIQLTDADCGSPTTQSSQPPSCSGGAVQTVSSVACGTHATCVLSFDGLTLSVSMTASPTTLITGSEAGTQFPAIFTSSTGITDNSASRNAWQISSSSDRVIGPLGQ